MTTHTYVQTVLFNFEIGNQLVSKFLELPLNNGIILNARMILYHLLFIIQV